MKIRTDDGSVNIRASVRGRPGCAADRPTRIQPARGCWCRQAARLRSRTEPQERPQRAAGPDGTEEVRRSQAAPPTVTTVPAQRRVCGRTLPASLHSLARHQRPAVPRPCASTVTASLSEPHPDPPSLLLRRTRAAPAIASPDRAESETWLRRTLTRSEGKAPRSPRHEAHQLLSHTRGCEWRARGCV